MALDLNGIAAKWQERWKNKSIFATEDPGKSAKKPFYCLEMLPYPSGKLHMGHVRNYSLGDVFARFKRMQGFNVLYPMGYDSFGLPAENAAIQTGREPEESTEANIASIKEQQQQLGFSYDWSRELATSHPDYYHWNQWFFLKMLEDGLAYKKSGMVNWCPECQTVLANEQVENGKCWRHGTTDVEQKELEQWYLKITDYAEELLQSIDSLEHWPERVKTMQRHWIGKSEGVEILFKLEDSDLELPTFTTRCDTVYSVTFLVIAPEHPLVQKLSKGTEQEAEVERVVAEIKQQTEIERTTPEGKDKLGAFLGKYAINPVNGERIPIYVANFVLMYGTGIVMADAHDQRDFEFAQKYKIPLKFVISPDGKPTDAMQAERAHLEDGVLFDSGEFSGMPNREALPKMATWLVKKKWGRKVTNYKLRDWLISRQRYWGTPIPVIYCVECGTVPVPEKELPVVLPKGADFSAGGNPLTTVKEFVEVSCPKCGNAARRETDTMDTFVDSSWYFLRYCDPQNSAQPFEKSIVNTFMPVQQYIGGIEHAVLHLLYARFFTKVLRDMELLKVDEPFTRLLTLGMVTKDGAKMSKSLGNTVDPSAIIEKYGPDTARLFILFAALPDKELEWSDEGIEASYRFLHRVASLREEIKDAKAPTKYDAYVESRLHSIMKSVTAAIEAFHFSTAIRHLMELVNLLLRYKEQGVNRNLYDQAVAAVVVMLSPVAPHLCEELWEQIGEGFVSLQPWPEHDEEKIDVKVEATFAALESLKEDIRTVMELAKIEKPKMITIFVAEQWKYSLIKTLKTLLEKTNDPKQIIAALMKSPLKQHGEVIMKLVPSLLKNRSKIPLHLFTQQEEQANYRSFEEEIGHLFNCKITLLPAAESKEQKAKSAMPGKPAILVS